ncbi:hypothetical protein [Bradyrhizobium erythrophlei]|uniref:hypothetical protein n=1 Tax=Bradyrhizobium erythrophlei TaxID=1437360 RepID=UPI003CC7FAEA
MLHDLAPRAHGLHHANPDEAVLTIFWQIWICFALVYIIAGGAFLAGALVAYAWYLFVHHCAHHGPDRFLKHHRSHHQFATRNYGVSTTLWESHIWDAVALNNPRGRAPSPREIWIFCGSHWPQRKYALRVSFSHPALVVAF